MSCKTLLAAAVLAAVLPLSAHAADTADFGVQLVVENACNIHHSPPTQGTIVVRHLDRVGVLASVLGALKKAEINVETMENIIFTGGVAACARIRVAQRPDDHLIEELTRLEHVLGVELT